MKPSRMPWCIALLVHLSCTITDAPKSKISHGPQLVDHDVHVGKGGRSLDGQSVYTFLFDKPIKAHAHRELVQFFSGNELVHVAIKRIVISHEQRMLEITVNNSHHDAQKKITKWRLGDAISTIDNIAMKPREISISSTAPLQDKASEATANVEPFGHGMLISWTTRQPRHGSIHLKGEGQATIDGQGQVVLHRHGQQDGYEKKSFTYWRLIGGLKPHNKYFVGLRIFGFVEQEEFLMGEVYTKDASFLRMSSILARPAMKKGEQESAGEFLGITNTSNEPVTMSNLVIRFLGEDGVEKSCQLWESNGWNAIMPAEEVLVVGTNFDARLAPVGKRLVRTKTKGICGGLPNARAQAVIIGDRFTGIHDAYGGHLWPAPKGKVIIKRDLMGLDEAANYCYAALGKNQCD